MKRAQRAQKLACRTRRRLLTVMALTGAGQHAGMLRAQSSQVVDAAAPAASSFDGLSPIIDTRYADVDSLVALQQGQLLFEHYRSGSNGTTLRDIQSVTKSVLGALVGRALAQRHLASLEQTVLVFRPDLADVNGDPQARQLTVGQLLAMTAGFGPSTQTGRRQFDDVRLAFARPFAAAPGTAFFYDNLASNLLASVLEAATAQTLADYARLHLFQPLGIQKFEWVRSSSGQPLGFIGLHLSTADMARVGQLFLQQGAWNGQQLLPETFARAAVEPQSAGGPPVGLPYGHGWWIVPSAAPKKTFFASGFGGQFVWVHTPLDLVVAATSATSEASNQRGQAITLIRNEVFRAVQRHRAPK